MELVNKLAKKIWDYHHMGHKLEKADCVLVFGSHDTRVAKRGAQLFLEGWASLIIFSGGLGKLTKDIWDQPEADKFAEIAIDIGVPKDKILIENKSTNMGENILFTKELLRKHNISPRKLILVQKPYMERRAYATFKKIWPEKEIIATSSQMSFEEYFEKYSIGGISKNDVINIMVGDLQRIEIYFEKGFQIYQKIPNDVWQAYEKLVELGYTKHLIK